MTEIHLGDCLEVLKCMPDASVDSCVTDPPYGLSAAKNSGKSSKGGFMGKLWDYDVPSVEIWKEVLRVLKPGGHMLAACGTRTQHRMALNIEDAGFEIRDVITWHYGSGFPKSLDVSKAIDKQAGAEREVVGKMKAKLPTSNDKYATDAWSIQAGKMRDINITAPSTDAAKKWSGYGTALKPATEFWTLARKPLEKKLTVAGNVLKHGCGGLNIDQSRIEGQSRPLREPDRRHENVNTYGNEFCGSKSAGTTTQGRFPSNVIFECTCALTPHEADCPAGMLDAQSGVSKSSGGGKKAGVKYGSIMGKVSDKDIGSEGYYGDTGGASRYFYCAKASKAERNRGLAKTDLVWEIDVWVKEDLRSALLAMSQLARDTSEDILMDVKKWSIDGSGNSIKDLFPIAMIFTISTVLKLITELKTSNVFQSSNIKESIQDAIVTIETSGLSLAETAEKLNRSLPNITNEKTVSLLGAVLALLPMLLSIRGYAKSGNFHATVKPIRLMEYLIRLITQPGGTILDPFMGSGSTGVAAKNLNFKFIGIELDPDYIEIAKKRIGA